SDGTFDVSASDNTGPGFNTVSIGAFPYAPTAMPPTFGGPVTVGNETFIWQGGAQNLDVLGGASAPGTGLGPFDFETGTLDIWTGDVGGSQVYAQNTAVDYGSGIGNSYFISGGGVNVYQDGGGNSVFGFGPTVLLTGPGY